ncbi:MAG: hypothetical protein PHE68_03380 [Candidatus Peribacteraceae bacterium]|nr:hypothetical protein [Candidatus Peribacteraceae bacterium]MDD5075061.1 hypothetical protein [Candidatus Peribacteraceae bacterium]
MHDHPNMTELLSRELAHPFHKDPTGYLDAHPEIEQQAFRPSPVRVIRTAGSGILKDPDQWADQLATYVQKLKQENGDGQEIEVEMTAHDTCGAGGLKRPGQTDTDNLAHADIEDLTARLVQRGVHAACPRKRFPMNGLSVHNALGVTIDLTEGCRLQCPPFNSFTLSSPDLDALPAEALTAGQISSKPAEENGHSYGNVLVDTKAPYTYLVYVEPDKEKESAPRIKAIQDAIEPLRAKGVATRIIIRHAPAASQRIPVRKVVVVCMDERCNAIQK